jgi:N-acetylglucosamine-6-phosphate deacetylase
MNSVTASQTLLLRNARVVGIERVVERASVLIETGRISRLADSLSSEKLRGDSELDLNGLTLFPGFIDLHIHGAAGVDTMAASAEDLNSVSEYLARHGVTGWLPTLVPAPREQYENAVSAIATAMREQSRQVALSATTADETSALPAEQARILGVHHEGPFVNAEECGALHREHFRAYKGAADLAALPTVDNAGAIHMMTLAPEIAGGIELVSELNKRDWIISIGHTRAGLEVLEQAFVAGARHLTHFMNAMPPLHHRAPGPVGWGLTREDVTCDLIADGIHIDPLILSLLIRTKTPKRISLISDAIAPAGLGDGEYRVWGETITVENGRTRNSRGSIAGSVISMLDAVRLVTSLGISEPDVARMAALNPARLLRVDKECGSIEEGKRADLVALDQEGSVRLTTVGGCVAYDANPRNSH